MKNGIIISLFVYIVLISCVTTQQTNSIHRLNVNFLYNPNAQSIHAKIIAHNKDSSTTTIYCKIPSSDLVFLPNGESSSCNLNFRCTLYETSQGLKLKDTLNFTRTIVNQNLPEYILQFDLTTKDTTSYMLDISISDPIFSNYSHQYINIERKGKINSNDFLLINKHGQPYFNLWLSDSDTFAIVLRKNLPREWKMAWFPNQFKLCSPPYQMSTNKDFTLPPPDSIRVKLICDTCFFTMKNASILHLYRDSIGNGKTIFKFSNNYPRLVRPSELLQPLRMLNSQKEFNELNIMADKKAAVDKFWLNTTDNVSRARELIRVFYTRAMLANQYFTSYTEGWKTDRGMIYIIFGLPTTLYKAPGVEQWIYGTPQSPKVLVFNFIKKQNPFSDNHYVLDRNEAYKIPWLQAVDTWRNGKVFSIGNE
ncbi:MAG: GWxTD domain-containing protein [Bacteroidales bacterium]